MKVLHGFRAERSAASAAHDEELSVEPFELLGSKASKLGVAEVREEVVLDGRHVAGMSG